jgi:hypothetical protein
MAPRMVGRYSHKSLGCKPSLTTHLRAQVFGEIMIDYSYVECTASAMQGLIYFNKLYPDIRKQEVRPFSLRGGGGRFWMSILTAGFLNAWMTVRSPSTCVRSRLRRSVP